MIIGLHTDPAVIIRNPGYLEALISNMDLNTLIFNEGFSLPDEIIKKAPLPLKGSVYTTGLRFRKNDSALADAIKICRDRGITPYISAGLWLGVANEYTEITDISSKSPDNSPLTYHSPVPYALEQKLVPCCPSNPEINEWFSLAFSSIVERYETDGIILNGLRYTSPAFYPGLFGCLCQRCKKLAESNGIDTDRLKNSFSKIQNLIKKCTADSISAFINTDFAINDFLQVSEQFSLYVKWLKFRADVLTDSVFSIRENMESLITGKFITGAELFPPSFALLAGQNYLALEKHFDIIIPETSQLKTNVLSNFASFANHMISENKALKEPDVLDLLYFWFGYGNFNLPGQIKELGINDKNTLNDPLKTPVFDIVSYELRKAKMLIRKDKTILSAINGAAWDQNTIREIMNYTGMAGCNGYIIYQGTDAIFDYRHRL